MMIASTLTEAASMMNGELHGSDRRFAGISTDTRTLKPDELFVALDGPNFRGRDFLPAAREKTRGGSGGRRARRVAVAQHRGR